MKKAIYYKEGSTGISRPYRQRHPILAIVLEYAGYFLAWGAPIGLFFWLCRNFTF